MYCSLVLFLALESLYSGVKTALSLLLNYFVPLVRLISLSPLVYFGGKLNYLSVELFCFQYFLNLGK